MSSLGCSTCPFPVGCSWSKEMKQGLLCAACPPPKGCSLGHCLSAPFLQGPCTSPRIAPACCRIPHVGTKVRHQVFPNAVHVGVTAMRDGGEKLVSCSVWTCGALLCVAVWLQRRLPASFSGNYLLLLYTALYHRGVIGPQPGLPEMLKLTLWVAVTM